MFTTLLVLSALLVLLGALLLGLLVGALVAAWLGAAEDARRAADLTRLGDQAREDLATLSDRYVAEVATTLTRRERP